MTRLENPRFYAAEIDLLARLKVKNGSLSTAFQTLKETDPANAAVAELTFSLLDDLGFIKYVDARAKTIAQEDKRDLKIKPKPPFHKQGTLFFDEEEGLARLHRDEKPGDRKPTPRRKLHGSEAEREKNHWNRYLHDIGQRETWGEKRARLGRDITMEKTLEGHMSLLRQLGVDKTFMEYGYTPVFIQKALEKLEKLKARGLMTPEFEQLQHLIQQY